MMDLSILIGFPIVMGFFLLFLRACPVLAQGLAGLSSFFCLGWAGLLAYHFNPEAGFQYIEWLPWFLEGDIAYALGMDGISLGLVMLNALLMPLIWIMVRRGDYPHYSAYMGSFLILEGLVFGSFLALDAVLFYVFFEAMLIPMFLLIGIWGGEKRKEATLTFFLFTFFGSIFLLIAFLYLHSACVEQGLPQPFSILSFQEVVLPFEEQCWLFLAMTLAFAIKIPMWPVHSWLPKAHVEASTEGSILLAAILLKMGAYGLLRFVLPILPDASQYYAPFMIGLSLFTVVYIGWVAVIQQNMKTLIAYSSIGHMAFVTLGLFILFPLKESSSLDLSTLLFGISGAYVQMLSHGLSSAGLFLSVGILYKRMHTKQIADYQGVAHKMPILATVFMIFAMANVGLPGTTGFVGEWLVILAGFSVSPWVAIIAGTTLVWSACYTLWMLRRVFFGPLTALVDQKLFDLSGHEKIVAGILAFLIIFFGLYPAPIFRMVEPSLVSVLDRIVETKAF